MHKVILNKKNMLVCGGFSLFLLTSCVTEHKIVNIQKTRLLVDNRYDGSIDADAVSFIAPYKMQVDSLMTPVVGKVAHDMEAYRPESPLSNLLADILIWGANRIGETPDFAVYNIGGIRAAFSRGEITKGNVLDVAPFENKLCLLSLSGRHVMQLFMQIAKAGGEGVSSEVRMVIDKDGSLKSATLMGKKIDTGRIYRIATIDYLAKGNDGLLAFKESINIFSPKSAEINVRDVILDYFKEKTAEGVEVHSRIEGRIIIR